ncbi:hypothetical protein SAMN05216557_105176 [Sphingomonas carotinifaciens]|uniref:Uncharacterized protein n=2 Tax=Sphingomonas carotinifaciens TaxID=1166323 RepID=A0A1G7NI24_9SPHN|nr:hypothetical protein [Sphingomonas carotinifaciens]MBB4087069.1 hypothetical protein [Sphingomonas carotinifaciens]MWC43242.1 hypothetical protein [Sphingomonas carotinifaciens]SDF73745.1 hypothetical protein SAMN05216557_105176 [Sphingomonas carotinifaciens]
MKPDWNDLIADCFCYGERAFAEHPSDEEAAFQLLSQLRQRHIGWSTFSGELERQLDGMPKLNAKAELARAHLYFRKWLLD